jgi:ubiquitin carboxyl-terminal hydrolase 25/28
VKYLRELFIGMNEKKQRSIKPQKQLSNLIFKGDSFGIQQDVSGIRFNYFVIQECLENLLDLIERGLKTDIVKKLFYGQTEQVLEMKGKETRKSEIIVHLILDVSDNLYFSLDLYFQPTRVDYENKQTAQRRLYLKEVPKILTIQLQRVKYQKHGNQIYKSNKYCAFDETLYLDRYFEDKCVDLKPEYERLVQERKELLCKTVNRKSLN